MHRVPPMQGGRNLFGPTSQASSLGYHMPAFQPFRWVSARPPARFHPLFGSVVITTPARMMAAAQRLCRLSDSPSTSQPSNTAITGFT